MLYESISMDRFIEYAIESDIRFDNEKDELEHLRKTKPIVRDELLTCYQYLEQKGLMDDYKKFRGD